MFHDIYLYNDQIVLADVQALSNLACANPCPVCPALISPACIETRSQAYVANWDFTKTTYTPTITDSGPNGFNMVLLNNQSSYDPVYVHNQGLYFNSNKNIVTTGRWNPNNIINSITLETWIRPSESVLNGELLSFQSATNVRDVSFKFSSNNLILNITGVTASIPLTYTAGMQNTWLYTGVSIFKTSATSSRV